MATKFVVDSNLKLVTLVADGVLERQHIADYLRALRRDPAFHPEFSELVDLSNVEESRITAKDQEELATLDPYAREAKRAFVAPQDVLYGYCRMYQMISDQPNIGVFRTKAEAFRWLGLFDDESRSAGAS